MMDKPPRFVEPAGNVISNHRWANRERRCGAKLRDACVRSSSKLLGQWESAAHAEGFRSYLQPRGCLLALVLAPIDPAGHGADELERVAAKVRDFLGAA